MCVLGPLSCGALTSSQVRQYLCNQPGVKQELKDKKQQQQKTVAAPDPVPDTATTTTTTTLRSDKSCRVM